MKGFMTVWVVIERHFDCEFCGSYADIVGVFDNEEDAKVFNKEFAGDSTVEEHDVLDSLPATLPT